jgi:hypothetical protein
MLKFVGFIIVLASLSGCTAVQDCHYETTNSLRTELAWLEAGPKPLDPNAPPIWGLASHYKHGWKQGYYDVAMGGAGQRPFLPPKKYWSACYQNARGERAVEFWFQGYHDGAEAGHQRGAGRFHYIRPYGPTGMPCVGPTPCVSPTPCAAPAPFVAPTPVGGPTLPGLPFEGVADPTEVDSFPQLPPNIAPPIQSQPMSADASQAPPSWELMLPSPSQNNQVTEPPSPRFKFEGPWLQANP